MCHRVIPAMNPNSPPMMNIVQQFIRFGSADSGFGSSAGGGAQSPEAPSAHVPADDAIGEGERIPCRRLASRHADERVYDAVDRAMRKLDRGLLVRSLGAVSWPCVPVLKNARPSYISTCRLRMSGLGTGLLPTNGWAEKNAGRSTTRPRVSNNCEQNQGQVLDFESGGRGFESLRARQQLARLEHFG